MHSGIKDAKRRSQPSVTVQASMKAQQTSKRALSAGPWLATPGLGPSAVRPVSDQLEGGEAEVKRNVLEKVKRWQGRKSRTAQSNHAEKSDLQRMNPDAGSRKKDGIRVPAQQMDTPESALCEKSTTRPTSPDRGAITSAKASELDGSCTKKVCSDQS